MICWLEQASFPGFPRPKSQLWQSCDLGLGRPGDEARSEIGIQFMPLHNLHVCSSTYDSSLFSQSEALQSWAAHTLAAVHHDFLLLVSMVTATEGGEGRSNVAEVGGREEEEREVHARKEMEVRVKEGKETVQDGVKNDGQAKDSGGLEEKGRGVLEQLWCWLKGHVLLTSSQLREKHRSMSSEDEPGVLARNTQELVHVAIDGLQEE